jgi:hypothetical protein
VVLVHVEAGVPDAWEPRLRAAAAAAVDRSTMALVEPPAVRFAEAALVLGCAEFDTACAAGMAGMSRAQHALLIRVLPADSGGFTLRVEGVKAGGQPVGPRESTALPDLSDESLRIAEVWVAGAVAGVKPTILIVTADQPAAEVLIDGVRVGTAPVTLVNAVAPGEHALRLQAPGRAPLTRTITVQAGTTNREHGLLMALGPTMTQASGVGDAAPAPLTPPGEAPPGPLVAAGVGVGAVGAVVAVVGGVVALVFGLPVLEYNGNITSGAQGPTLRQDYVKLGGEVLRGDARFVHLNNTFGLAGDAHTADPDGYLVRLNAATRQSSDRAVMGAVLVGGGALLVATGVGLAMGLSGAE